MFHLVVAACLVSDPAICADRQLPAGDAASAQACEANAAGVVAEWSADHADLRMGAHRCVTTESLPAAELDEVAPDVWVRWGVVDTASAENRGRIANLGVLLGTTVTVIDPGGSRADAEALYAAIRRRTDAPVGHVIVTHMHPDHSLGTALFTEAGAKVIAAEGMADELAARQDTYLGRYAEMIGKAEMLGTAIVLPTDAVGAAQELDADGISLFLNRAPVAHTPADLFVLHRASGTLFTGDLVFRGLTPVIDGSLSGWLDWLATQPGATPPQRIVPGHGPLAMTWAEAAAPMTDYLTSLRETTREAVARGLGLTDATRFILTAMEGHADGWADFADTTERNAATAFQELEWE